MEVGSQVAKVVCICKIGISIQVTGTQAFGDGGGECIRFSIKFLYFAWALQTGFFHKKCVHLNSFLIQGNSSLCYTILFFKLFCFAFYKFPEY